MMPGFKWVRTDSDVPANQSQRQPRLSGYLSPLTPSTPSGPESETGCIFPHSDRLSFLVYS